jgi:hypothetical protein
MAKLKIFLAKNKIHLTQKILSKSEEKRVAFSNFSALSMLFYRLINIYFLTLSNFRK